MEEEIYDKVITFNSYKSKLFKHFSSFSMDELSHLINLLCTDSRIFNIDLNSKVILDKNILHFVKPDKLLCLASSITYYDAAISLLNTSYDEETMMIILSTLYSVHLNDINLSRLRPYCKVLKLLLFNKFCKQDRNMIIKYLLDIEINSEAKYFDDTFISLFINENVEILFDKNTNKEYNLFELQKYKLSPAVYDDFFKILNVDIRSKDGKNIGKR
jgi:hypothetical protein